MIGGKEKRASIESKNLMLLEDQMRLEALSAKKSELYAEYFQDPVLKGFAQQLAMHHKDNFSSLLAYLGEQR
jgi:ferritin